MEDLIINLLKIAIIVVIIFTVFSFISGFINHLAEIANILGSVAFFGLIGAFVLFGISLFTNKK
jgi:hypothetical protein